jgi:methyl-accepting chemotaxis protein
MSPGCNILFFNTRAGKQKRKRNANLALNCWEFKRCGREQSKDCPAVSSNMGRACWRVAGTMCGAKVQGAFAEKLGNCKSCDYYSYMNNLKK